MSNKKAISGIARDRHSDNQESELMACQRAKNTLKHSDTIIRVWGHFVQGKVFLHTLKIYCIITQLRLVFIIMTVSPQSEIYLGHNYKTVIEYILERRLLVLIEFRFFSTTSGRIRTCLRILLFCLGSPSLSLSLLLAFKKSV